MGRKRKHIEANKVSNPDVEVITFENPSKRKFQSTNSKKDQRSTNESNASRTGSEPVLSLKDVSFDVFKLGITGLDEKSKRESEIALAVRLGAKPPKRECKNYKLLQKERKEKKLQEAELQKDFAAKFDTVNVKTEQPWAVKKPKNRKKTDSFHAQMGTYKGGVQMFSKTDIQRIKKIH